MSNLQAFVDPYHLIDTAPPGWPVFTYQRRHIPSGISSTAQVAVPNRAAFFELLAHWSRSAPHLWQYWEGDTCESNTNGKTETSKPLPNTFTTKFATRWRSLLGLCARLTPTRSTFVELIKRRKS